MFFRHQYNSTSPYEDCGFCRSPSYPAANQKVRLGFRVEDAQTADIGPVFLCWMVNGKEQPPLKLTPDGTDENGQTYLCVSLPARPAFDWVEYWIESSTGIQSERFHYQVLGRIQLEHPAFWLCGRDRLDIWFAAPSGAYCWSWEYVSPGGVQSRFAWAPRLPEAPMPPEEHELRWGSLRVQPSQEMLSFYRGAERGLRVPLQLSLLVDPSMGVWEAGLTMYLPGRHLYGTGERYTCPDQAGRFVCFSSFEHFTHQGQRSYLPVPLFYTEKEVGVLHTGSCEFTAGFTQRDDVIAAELRYQCVPGESIFQDEILLGTPKEILAAYLSKTGDAIAPPEWCFGPWVSANCWESAAQVEHQLEQLKRTRIPASVMVLERWSDDTIFDRFEDAAHLVRPGNHCFVDGELDFSNSSRWPDPKTLCQEIEDQGLKLILWQAPILRLPPCGHYPQAEEDIKYAIQQRFCVMMPDGTPFRCPDGWFKNSLLLDFTNPDAVAWWCQKRKYLLTDYHVVGFKTDSGELVTDDRAVFCNGQNGRQMRNVYPLYYEAAYRALLTENHVQGVNFTRAGYTGAQCFAIHWTGDQRSCFEEVRAQLSACLSAGLSGVLFMGFDLSGFAGRMPDCELYCRSISFAAFSTLMQFHSEPIVDSSRNERSPWNMAQKLHSSRLIDVYRQYAQLRMHLIRYLSEEAAACIREARPLMAHLVFDWPQDPVAQECHDQYMLGRSLLIAPVLTAGALGRRVYLPEGKWVHLFTGRSFGSGWHQFECGMTDILVFVKLGTPLSDFFKSSSWRKEDAESTPLLNSSDPVERSF